MGTNAELVVRSLREEILAISPNGVSKSNQFRIRTEQNINPFFLDQWRYQQNVLIFAGQTHGSTG